MGKKHRGKTKAPGLVPRDPQDSGSDGDGDAPRADRPAAERDREVWLIGYSVRCDRVLAISQSSEQGNLFMGRL